MKGYFIEITNNLLDPKHQKAMKESVWLFMWLIDKMTSITEEGIGRVLGGKPIKYEEDIKKELGISLRTYQRWILILKRGNYINVIKAPYGLIISVNKAKKIFKRQDKNVQRQDRSGTSNIRQYKDIYNKEDILRRGELDLMYKRYQTPELKPASEVIREKLRGLN
jgi:hypothetical protein